MYDKCVRQGKDRLYGCQELYTDKYLTGHTTVDSAITIFKFPNLRLWKLL